MTLIVYVLYFDKLYKCIYLLFLKFVLILSIGGLLLRKNFLLFYIINFNF